MSTETITLKLISKCPKYPSGTVDITVSSQDVDWIKFFRITLGENNHPIVVPKCTSEGRRQSLARMVMQRHDIPVDDNQPIWRIDTNRPLDVSHENICVPVDAFQRHLNVNEELGVRTISLKDYLAVFSVTRPSIPEADPVLITCLNMDNARQAFLVGDADDASWLEGKPVRFNEKGFPMIQSGWDKWTSIMFEQARRAGANELENPVVFHLKPSEPLDIRKYFIGIVTKNNCSTLQY